MKTSKWTNGGYVQAYESLVAAEIAIHDAKRQLRLSWQHGPADGLTYHKLASILNQADERIKEVVTWGGQSYSL